MKKVLLTAAAAVMFTAAAGAQTLQLTGQISTYLSYDGAINQFAGPYFGGGEDDGLFISFTGAANGWNYEFQDQIAGGLLGDYAELTLSNELLGTFYIDPGRIEWVREMFGGTEVSIAIEPSNLEEFEFALEGTVAGIGYDITAVNNANREFQAEVFAPISGVDFRLGMTGSLHDTSASSSFEYGVEIETNVMGVETQISMDEAGSVEARAELGAFGVSVDLGDGDMFDRVGLEYTSNVTEQMEIHAEVLTDGTDTDAYAQLVLRF